MKQEMEDKESERKALEDQMRKAKEEEQRKASALEAKLKKVRED